MPFFQKIECGNAWGGVWQITESFDELCDRLPDGAGHKAYAMRRFAAERRKLEYAAVRMLIYVLTGKDKTVDYLLSGHPFPFLFHLLSREVSAPLLPLSPAPCRQRALQPEQSRNRKHE